MTLTQRYADTLDEIRDAGLFKSERIITSPQSARDHARRRAHGAELLREQLPRAWPTIPT